MSPKKAKLAQQLFTKIFDNFAIRESYVTNEGAGPLVGLAALSGDLPANGGIIGGNVEGNIKKNASALADAFKTDPHGDYAALANDLEASILVAVTVEMFTQTYGNELIEELHRFMDEK